MKTRQIIYAAFAIIALASCTSNDYVGDDSPQGSIGTNGAISFNMSTPAITRAADKTGAEAATDLGGQFIVYAEKDETADGAAPVSGKLVFQNYKVAWTSNSANTTTSNTKSWEYVGLSWTAAEQGNITTSTTDAQTIKYWDWGAASYTFTAVSALSTDISNGKVKITKTTAATDGNKVYDKGYNVVLTSDASLDKLFFSERKVISKSNNTDRTQANAYGGNVTFRFHNMISKVRVAMYETIPGYSVTINKFSVDNDGENPAFSDMTDNKTDNFAANFQSYVTGTPGTLTVKYQNTGTQENYPTVSFSGATNYILTLGDQLKADVTIGTTATGATYDKAEKAYTSVFPKEDNTQNLKLKVSYTLTAPVTGETIIVTDATAEIPANYLKWKPGYAYTYIFKVSDNTNGSTGTPGTNPAGLYPITFDAVETVDNDGIAEYITTVSEPTITTFGVNSSTGKYVVGGNEYAAGTDIYATVMDASSLATLSASNFSIYDVTTSDATNFPITEASVAEALIEGPTWTKAQADLKKITCAAGPALTFQNTVPAEDGTTKTLHASDNKAAKFTTATGKKYALVYQKTAATYTTDGGKNDYTSESFTAAGTLYTNAECTTVAESWSSGTTYYKLTAVTNMGVYAIKIVTVE